MRTMWWWMAALVMVVCGALGDEVATSSVGVIDVGDETTEWVYSEGELSSAMARFERAVLSEVVDGDRRMAALTSRVASLESLAAGASSDRAVLIQAVRSLAGRVIALEASVEALGTGAPTEPSPPLPEPVDLGWVGIHAFGDERQPASDATAVTQAAFAALHDVVILRAENEGKIARWREAHPDLVALLWTNYPMRADGDRSVALDAAADAPIWMVGSSPVLLRGWESQHSGLHDLSVASTRAAKAESAAARVAGTAFDGVFMDNALVPCRAESLARASSRTLIAGKVSPVIPDGYRGDATEAVDVADGIRRVAAAVDVLAVNPGVVAGQVGLINALGADWVVEEHAFTGSASQVWAQIEALRSIETGRLVHAYLPEPYFSDAGLREFWWACFAMCRTEGAPLCGSLYPVRDSVSASRAAYEATWGTLAEEVERVRALGHVVSLGRVGDVVTAEFEGGVVVEVDVAGRRVTRRWE